MHLRSKCNGIFNTGTACEPLFGTQRMLLWTKQASLEKTWVTSMLKGTLLVLFLTWTCSFNSHMFECRMHFSVDWTHSQIADLNLTSLYVLDGCQAWRSTSRRLMFTTDLWMVMEISTGDSSLSLTTCLQSSYVLSRGRWVTSTSRNKA